MTIIKAQELEAKILELETQSTPELTEVQIQAYLFAVMLQDYETQAQCRKNMLWKKVPEWAIEQVLEATKPSRGTFATGPRYDVVSGYFTATER